MILITVMIFNYHDVYSLKGLRSFVQLIMDRGSI